MKKELLPYQTTILLSVNIPSIYTLTGLPDIRIDFSCECFKNAKGSPEIKSNSQYIGCNGYGIFQVKSDYYNDVICLLEASAKKEFLRIIGNVPLLKLTCTNNQLN